jgi:DNA-binding MarR family transcriptional regulator
MAGKLQLEMQRTHPFDSVQQEVFLNIVRTADRLVRGFDELFKPWKLSVTQYNVLRILRFGGENGLSCKQIGERMLTRDPDITRLLNRLEARNLISRQRGAADRRVVAVRITPDGITLLNELDKPVMDYHNQQMAQMNEPQLGQVIELMEAIREMNVAPKAPEIPADASHA